MHNIIVTTPEELEHLIQKTVRRVLSEQKTPPPLPPPEKPMSIKEADKYLWLAVQNLYGYSSNVRITFIKKSRRVIFIKADLDNWMQEGKKESSNKSISNQEKEELIWA